MNPRRIGFWIHLTLGIAAGIVGALMAGTGVIMAFADTYLDIREYQARRVDPPLDTQPLSLAVMMTSVNAGHSDSPVTRIGIDRDPRHAIEFYHDPQKLEYADPFTGEIRPSNSVPLRRTLHKGVEQWHRFLGLQGDNRARGKRVASWTNVLLIPLIVTGLVLWWPTSFRWRAIKSALLPGPTARRSGTQRSWHSALGFWASVFLLVMVLTATTHSFEWVRNTATSVFGDTPTKPGSHDSLWAPGLGKLPVPDNAAPLSLDELRAIASREIPNWTRLDIFLAPPPGPDNHTGTVTLSAKAPGWGPPFFPTALQVHPHTGEVLDVHSWDDLSGGTRFLAWSRWLHKGEAFGRSGQIVAGLACLLMLMLIYTGWALAIQRLVRSRRVKRDGMTVAE